ncbi:FkbM family methyltransferase [Aeromicrobium sp. CnD17-E]|uniref:FkbM family methyltransferase n=1 Tax=Aeromicrobium sp. CnD17-E TaxID=2954487 RepID=UPI002096EB46|nr:FkbM family methyltransferase [Aeromicrobium sp. CnD17-E]MCO7239613.1 FkbM family methyltransferase [Aeromicrobium sp. CnD17-E]
MSGISHVVMRQLARRGLVVRRHPAARRQRLLVDRGVDLVLDVGAARGGYATELREFGYTGRIVSFEPLAAAHADLVRAAASDPRWETRHTALGDTTGRQEIHVASNSDSSSLLPMADQHRASSPDIQMVGTETIEVSRLDDVAADVLGEARTPFLKIDTQGFERAVLEGAETTVPRLVGLQLELSFVTLYEGGMLANEAISWAYDHGFVLVGLDQGFTDPGGAVLQADGVFLRP